MKQGQTTYQKLGIKSAEKVKKKNPKSNQSLSSTEFNLRSFAVDKNKSI
ncbi:hypothetical protein [Flavobacterium frigoris]|uniref:Uncharacterized protein n=1 Tax=Flavobacterium frigoris (strain PS1) TaxID=1086011 RepID=H7FLF3_FLAFP|nr:hypothetical protein [Flavobacterium frigoris]EIA10668.1 hypothetical protein HJ01_00002 [Flavobacterium frigoris PS1]